MKNEYWTLNKECFLSKSGAKVMKISENEQKFRENLARMKKSIYFCSPLAHYRYKYIKIYSNEKNISTPQSQEKKQARFP